ncbi:MAG: AAA family ATPase [Anaerolineae bacterium]
MTESFFQPEEMQIAQQKVTRFVERYEPAYRLLLYHAALPLVLTPELLNYLRTKFLQGEVPWVAEADLLLSDLCQQVGYEQYVMDSAVRAYLLQEMKQDAALRSEQMEAVARLLIHYVRHLSKTDAYLDTHELQAQQWAAMVYLDDQNGIAVQQMAAAIKESISAQVADSITGIVNQAELLRLTQVIKSTATALEQYPELIKYAADVTELLSDTTGDIARKFDETGKFRHEQNVVGISLPSLNSILSHRQLAHVHDNPFGNLMPVTRSEDFFDREQELKQIFGLIQHGSSISIVGESGVGKTSILRMICALGPEYLNLSSVVFMLIDLQQIRSDEEFYVAFSNNLGLSSVFRGYKLAQALEDNHYVLCLDEIEQLTKDGFTDEIPDLLRSLAISRNLLLVVTSRIPLQDVFEPGITSPLFNIFQTLEVDNFEPAIAEDFLRQRLRHAGIQFTPGEILSLVETTGGKPRQLQQAAYSLYEEKRSIETEVAALRETLEPNISPFINRYEEIRWIIGAYAPPYILINAPAGYGKTALLRELQRHFTEHNWQCAYISCRMGWDLKAFTLELANQIGIELRITGNESSSQIGYQLGNAIAARLVDRNEGFALLVDDIDLDISTQITEVFLNEFLPAFVDTLRLTKVGFRLILASRSIHIKSTKIPLTIVNLTPFGYKIVEELIRLTAPNYDEAALRLLSAHIVYFTAGHPGCISSVLERYDLQRFLPEFLQSSSDEIWEAIVLPVVNDIRHKVPTEILSLLDTLSIYRRFNFNILRKLVEKHILMQQGDVRRIEDLLTANFLATRKQGLLLISDIYRRLLVLRLQKANPDQFSNFCKLAQDIYSSSIQDSVRHTEILAIEVLYQFLQQTAPLIQELYDRRKIRQTFFAQKVPEVLGLLTDRPDTRERLMDMIDYLKEDQELQFIINYHLRENEFVGEPFDKLISAIEAFSMAYK